jgi:hypothetical protein
MKNLIRFLTVVFAMITLSALLAHLFALSGKINLSREDYQTVQGIYRGWALIGIVETGAILLTFIWMVMDRGKKRAFPFLLTALICFVISYIVFFVFTFPANNATANWTTLLENWQILRHQWEYSHACRAILNFIGFCALILVLVDDRIK